MRQKAAPNAAQGRLDAYPPHPCGQIRVARRKHGSILRLPPAFGAFQRRCKVSVVKYSSPVQSIPSAKYQLRLCPRPQGYGRELQHAHHFITLRRISGESHAVWAVSLPVRRGSRSCLRCRKTPAPFQKAHRQCAVLLLSAYRIVYRRAGTMASLVKGQGGSQRHAVSFHAQTLQEACHMAVVADVVGAAPILAALAAVGVR